LSDKSTQGCEVFFLQKLIAKGCELREGPVAKMLEFKIDGCDFIYAQVHKSSCA
jgi:hypothetical protein